jgi:glucose-1-phosphate thymidylyltransferase
MQASLFVQSIEDRQGLMLACLEEIAWRAGYITSEQVRCMAAPMKGNQYGQYLLRMIEQPQY